MFEGLMEGRGATIALAFAVVTVGLVLLALVMRLIRGRGNATFIRGGKNRQPRLAVLDAAAVDTRRRLVLVRRDDVEHLIMIGGPSDIVIESRILPPSMPAIDPVPLSDRLVDEPRAQAQPAARAASQPVPQQAARPVAEKPLPQPVVQPVAQSAARPADVPAHAAERKPAPLASATPPLMATPAAPKPAPMPVPMPQPYAEFAEPAPASTAPIAASTAPNHQDADAANVLDAARSRVLIDRDRAARDPNLTVAELIEGRHGGQGRVQAPRPDGRTAVAASAMTAPAVTATSLPETGAAISGGNPFDDADFGAILDAEMSGDLASLDVSPADNGRPVAPSPRNDQVAVPSPAARTEGSLEEEMARLLGDMAPTRR
jgi:hypothetical protein